MPKGYWIARLTVNDATRYPEYVAMAAPAYARFGAKIIIRGGVFEEAEGTARPRNVVVEFPTHQAAIDCYHSPEYTAARAIRQSIADGEFIIIEGYEA
jgi:uncharacterized protein (DUF1330 family)